MSRMLAPKLALARAVGAMSRVGGGGGTSLPGKLLVRMEPGAISALAGRLPQGSAVISATNGKTTTATLAASIFERAGVELVHNRAGANMAGGIASTLLGAARRGGRIDGELGVFEVDEFWLDRLLPQLSPRAVLLGNLFRDQLDRYGELDTIAERWAAALAAPAGQRARLVCNADDPLVADLGRERRGHEPETGGSDRHPGHEHATGRSGGHSGHGPEILFFGVEDDSLALPGMSHAADAKHCRRCGSPYAFDAVYLGHLGRYHCPTCGQSRPYPTVRAHSVRLEGVRRARFTLTTPAGSALVELALPGLYNVYNALAAAALATALDVPLPTIVDGLQSTGAAFGRAETVQVAGRQARILLVKNPAGANEVLRTLALEAGEHELLGVLNDRTADGHDVSWIWDADFELLAGRVRRAVCSGTRAAELGLRLKYAGVEPDRIEVIDRLDRALAAATVTDNRAADDRAGHHARARGTPKRNTTPPPTSPDQTADDLYVLPTYTAMLELRELLVRRGEARSSWP